MWGSLLHHQNQEAPLEGEKLDPPPLHGTKGLHQPWSTEWLIWFSE